MLFPIFFVLLLHPGQTSSSPPDAAKDFGSSVPDPGSGFWTNAGTSEYM